MRVLLDACVPRRLRDQLPKDEVRTAQQMGWGNLDDGPLLDAMANHFDGLVTVDKGLAKQQNINARSFGLVVLRAKTNRLADLLPLVPRLRETLQKLRPGEVHELTS